MKELRLFSADAEEYCAAFSGFWVELLSCSGRWVALPPRFGTFLEGRDYIVRLGEGGYFPSSPGSKYVRLRWEENGEGSAGRQPVVAAVQPAELPAPGDNVPGRVP